MTERQRGWSRSDFTGSWRRVDPLTCVVGASALVVYALHGFDGMLKRDLAVYSYAGQQVADGVPPYVGILNRAGPLAHLIPAIGVAGVRVGGFDELLGIRLLFMLLSGACVCVVFVLGRALFGSQLAGLAGAAALLSFSGFIEYASNGPREKTPMVLFLLCALLAMTRQRWVAAGFCLSLATLVWHPVFLIGLSAMLVAVVGVPRPGRIRALVRVAVGGLIPASACLVYFAVVGALYEFIDGFLLINARYTQALPLTRDLAKNWNRLQSGYGTSLWVLLLGLAALVVLSVAATRRLDRRQDPLRASVAAVGAAAVAGIIWTFRDFNGWPDAFVLLPLAALGVSGLAAAVHHNLSQRAALPVTLTWVVVAVGLSMTFSIAERDHRLDQQRASVAAVLGELPSDASILSIRAPQALVLSGKTNPTRNQMSTAGLDRYIDDTYPGGTQGFSAWIGRRQPTVIALGGEPVPAWFVDTLHTKYWHVGEAPDWTWYVSSPSDPLSGRHCATRSATHETADGPARTRGPMLAGRRAMLTRG